MPLPLTNEPRDLLLDSDNDLIVTSDLDFSRGIEAVAQSCRIALQMVQGEWFLDLDVGIPYWEEILAQKPLVAIEASRVAFRRELLSIEGVIDILKLDITYISETRTMSVVWQVLTGLGETPTDTIALEIGS